MKRAKASEPVKKVKDALEQRRADVAAVPADITESFRRARSSLGDITSDLQRLRKRAMPVKPHRRQAK